MSPAPRSGHVLDRLASSVAAFIPESRVLGAGRTVLALAQASVLAFTPSSYLFVPVGGPDVHVPCDGLPQQASAYCLVGGGHRQAVSWVLLAILLVVASGLWPRLLAVLHAWVALTLHLSISLPDGGEAVAQVCTLFLVLACLDDRRRWHWSAPRPPGAGQTSPWRGIAWAGSWALRVQVAYIYVNSALTKTHVGPWQDGTATYYVARMENFGAAGLLAHVFLWSTSLTVVALLTAWGTIVAETAVGVLVLGRARQQVVGLVLSTSLHTLIVLQLGIASFGSVMIGVVLCATSGGVDQVRARGWTPQVTRDPGPRPPGPAVPVGAGDTLVPGAPSSPPSPPRRADAASDLQDA